MMLDALASWIRLARVRANCGSISALFSLSFLVETAISSVASRSAPRARVLKLIANLFG